MDAAIVGAGSVANNGQIDAHVGAGVVTLGNVGAVQVTVGAGSVVAGVVTHGLLPDLPPLVNGTNMATNMMASLMNIGNVRNNMNINATGNANVNNNGNGMNVNNSLN